MRSKGYRTSAASLHRFDAKTRAVFVGHHCLNAGEAGAAAGGPRIYDEALNTLAEFCRTSDSDAARVSAANALLDRGYGKLLQQIEAGAPGDFNFASMSGEELDAMIAENMASLGYTKTD